jgi:hypothetical protein
LLSQILTNLIGAAGNDLFLIYSEASNLEELISEIEIYKADVFVIEKSYPFAEDNSVTRLLLLFSKLLVIIINEDSNWLSIFRREDKLLVSSSDLLDAIASRLDYRPTAN